MRQGTALLSGTTHRIQVAGTDESCHLPRARCEGRSLREGEEAQHALCRGHQGRELESLRHESYAQQLPHREGWTDCEDFCRVRYQRDDRRTVERSHC